ETYALSAPPRAIPRDSMLSADRRVLLLNHIEYDDPVLVNSIIEEQKQRYSLSVSAGISQPLNNGVLHRSPLATHSKEKGSGLYGESILRSHTPVMERKRGAGLKRAEPRQLFPQHSTLSLETSSPLKEELFFADKELLPSPPPPPTEPLPLPPVPEKSHK